MQLSPHNLIDDVTGRTNRAVLRALVHEMAGQGGHPATPRSLRSSQRYFACLLAQRLYGWRQRHGLPVRTVEISAYGIAREGVRRSRF